MSEIVKAMIFVLHDRVTIDGKVCLDYCIAKGYRMVGVVQDDWHKACDYLYRRECDVLVVADDRALDPDRRPRVEVVAHLHTAPERPDVPTGRRSGKQWMRNQRTRMLKRGAEA